MADLKIPPGPEAVTPGWLTHALRSTGTINNAIVESFEVEQIDKAFMGQLAMFTLNYDINEESAPASLIAKFPTNHPELRSMVDGFGFYEREIRFYEEIAPQIELWTPRRYYSTLDAETRACVLLIEHIADTHLGTRALEEMKLTFRHLAKFHAAWWESPRLEGFDWMPFFMTNNTEIGGTVYRRAWDLWIERFADKLPDSFRKLGARYSQNLVNIWGRLESPPLTVVHGDFHAGNLLYIDGESDTPPVVIDWIPVRGRGVYDVAYFLMATLPPDRRKTAEMDVLRTYHAALMENGVQGYSFDQCLYDYQAIHARNITA